MAATRRAVLGGIAAGLAAPAITRVAPGAAGDAALLGEVYRALHPGLHRYLSAAQLADAEARLAHGMAAAPDAAGRYLALARFTAAVRCGHSYPNPNNQRRGVRDGLLGTRTHVPFRFRWIGERMVVTQGLGADPLPAGTEVLAFDGEPAPALLHRLLPLARADGHNRAKQVAVLGVGAERWAAFDVYRSLSAPGAPRETATLDLRLPDGRRQRRAVALMTDAERVAGLPDAKGDAALWTFARVGDVGVLTMPTWATYDSKWDWRGFLAATFRDLAGARGLVVDLRGNEGGEDCGNAIVARLIDRPVAYDVTVRRTRYRRVPAALDRYLDTWDDSFRDWGADATGPDAQGFYRMTRFDDPPGQGIAPEGPRFGGKVAVLVGADNSSACFQFAQLVRRERLATLVGEPTGGNLRGINGGAFFFLRLPDSGLEVDVPLIGAFPLAPQPDAGLIPDVPAAPTARDIAAGRDVALARALAVAGGRG
jgi:hypothetical protein